MPKKTMPKTYKGKSTAKGKGGAFAYVEDQVAASEMKSGKSATDAKRIGEAVAAKQGRAKYGKEEFARMGAAGRKRAAKKGK